MNYNFCLYSFTIKSHCFPCICMEIMFLGFTTWGFQVPTNDFSQASFSLTSLLITRLIILGSLFFHRSAIYYPWPFSNLLNVGIDKYFSQFKIWNSNGQYSVFICNFPLVLRHLKPFQVSLAVWMHMNVKIDSPSWTRIND